MAKTTEAHQQTLFLQRLSFHPQAGSPLCFLSCGISDFPWHHCKVVVCDVAPSAASTSRGATTELTSGNRMASHTLVTLVLHVTLKDNTKQSRNRCRHQQRVARADVMTIENIPQHANSLSPNSYGLHCPYHYTFSLSLALSLSLPFPCSLCRFFVLFFLVFFLSCCFPSAFFGVFVFALFPLSFFLSLFLFPFFKFFPCPCFSFF